jgi:hypothetical protein
MAVQAFQGYVYSHLYFCSINLSTRNNDDNGLLTPNMSAERETDLGTFQGIIYSEDG